MGAQICFEEVQKTNKIRSKDMKTSFDNKESKKKSRRLQKAATNLQSHHLSALSSDYELPTSHESIRGRFGGKVDPPTTLVILAVDVR